MDVVLSILLGLILGRANVELAGENCEKRKRETAGKEDGGPGLSRTVDLPDPIGTLEPTARCISGFSGF